MKITCVCPTHGRPYHVNEALQSFGNQDALSNIEYELLIFNDCPEQQLRCDCGGVRVVNSPKMYADLSEKFNAAVNLCDCDVIAWWEDDDISLPKRLLQSSSMMFGLRVDAYKQNRAWYWNNGDITGRPVNLFFGDAIFVRTAWRGATVGQPADRSAWENMTNECTAIEEYPKPDDTYFIYRWAGTGHHDSAVQGTNADRFASFRFAVTHDPRFQRGEIELVPAWAHRYDEQAALAARDPGRRNKT